ncbi:MAG TPA: hypothetical protein VMS60_05075 [Solirubrobacterales bacterium]|nr:hypothetical protein [Solirubrobacterales bacterium]
MKPKLTFANVVALVALFISLGGTVYAAAKINGKTIRKESIPANRLVPDSVGGAQVDESSLGAVPNAAQAEEAGRAEEAERAKHVSRAESAALATNADEVLRTALAGEADRAKEADLVPSAENALNLGGVPADDFGVRCEDGTVKGYVLVNAANQKVREFNCTGAAVTVDDKTNGRFEITFASLQNAEMGIVSTAGNNTAATAEHVTGAGLFEVIVASTNGGQRLPDEPFALVVF